MKFEIGEEVTIKENFWDIDVPDYSNPGWNDTMAALAGKSFKITECFKETNCYFLECSWTWHEKWLEPCSKINIKDISQKEIVTLIEDK